MDFDEQNQLLVSRPNESWNSWSSHHLRSPSWRETGGRTWWMTFSHDKSNFRHLTRTKAQNQMWSDLLVLLQFVKLLTKFPDMIYDRSHPTCFLLFVLFLYNPKPSSPPHPTFPTHPNKQYVVNALGCSGASPQCFSFFPAVQSLMYIVDVGLYTCSC